MTVSDAYKTNETDHKIATYIDESESGKATAGELARYLGIQVEDARKHLETMMSRGLIMRVTPDVNVTAYYKFAF